MIRYRHIFSLLAVFILNCLLSDFSLVFGNEFRYDSHGKRDPFLSPTIQNIGESQISHGELRLEGIVLDKEGQSYAIVNSEIVREGQVFQGFLLQKITAQEVTFQKDEETFKVPLRQDDEMMNQYLNQENE